MPTAEEKPDTPYFDTPERAERFQLIEHLLRNAEEVPYLRAPEGAGKTRFARRLLEVEPREFTIVWLNALAGTPIDIELYAQMGLTESDAVWPNDILTKIGDQVLLLIIDDADALDLESLTKLFELRELGAHLLFLGNGGLAQLQGDWSLQFVDLPPFTEQQTLDFLRASGYIASGQVNESMVAGLHRAAAGLPGHLKATLAALPKQGLKKPSRSPLISPLVISIVLVCAVFIGLGWFFQDDINAFFEMPDEGGKAASKPFIYTFDEKDSSRDSEAVDDYVEPGLDTPADIQEIDLWVAEPDAGPVPVPEPVVELSVISDAPEPSGQIAEGQERVAQPVPGKEEPAAAPVAEEPAASREEADALFDAVVEAAIAAAEQGPVEQGTADEKAVRPLSASRPVPVKPQGQPKVEPVPATEPAPETVPPAGLVKTPVDADTEWLRVQKPTSYTLQLVGARDKPSIRKFIAKHQIAKPYAIFERDLDGRPWYSLVAGVYADRDAAVLARSRLKSPLNGAGAWPRTFASIQKGLAAQ